MGYHSMGYLRFDCNEHNGVDRCGFDKNHVLKAPVGNGLAVTLVFPGIALPFFLAVLAQLLPGAL